MPEFSPHELDRLEDLLEGLEERDDLSGLDLEAPVLARAIQYQRLLRASREALPLEAVRDGLLDGVLAEAGEARQGPPPRARASGRWRRTLIPVFALAGTTAAVLWLVRPAQEVAPVRRTGGDEPSAVAEAEAIPEAVPPGVPSPDSAALADEPAAEVAREDAEARGSEPAPATKRSDEAKKKASTKPSVTDAPAPEPPVQEKLADKEVAWDQLEQADDARRLGDCDTAMALYRQALDTALNGKGKAQAQMGLGLCEEQQGGDGSKLLQDAVANDPSKEAEIRRERDAAASKKQKALPKKKAESAAKGQPNALPKD